MGLKLRIKPLRICFGKKAMSGLIIVVLLVAIALAIGAMVMGWLMSFSKSKMDSTKVKQLLEDACSALDMQVIKIEINDSNATTGNYNVYINVKVENKGKQKLAGLVIKGLTNKDGLLADSKEFTPYLGEYKRGSLNVSDNMNCASDGCYVNEVVVIPRVEINPGTPEIHECRNIEYHFKRSDSVVRLLS